MSDGSVSGIEQSPQTTKPIKFPQRSESKSLFWKNMGQQKKRAPHLSVGDRVQISRDRTADQLRTLIAKERAGKDSLTGLYNKSGFDDAVKRNIADAKRHGAKKKMTIVVIDVDNLKPINDSQGHEAGDNLLKRVANTMKKSGRETDAFARMGGDEFEVLLVDSDEENSLLYCNRLRDELKAKNMGDHVSMGLGELDYSNPEMIASSRRGADLAMLLAKAEYKEGVSDQPKRAGEVPLHYIMDEQELKRRAEVRNNKLDMAS